MSFVMNVRTTEDTFTDGNTLTFPVVSRINIDVANQPIYYQLQSASGDGSPQSNAGRWSPEVFMPAAFRSLDRRCTGVRIRSAIAGSPAIVSVEAIPPNELGPEASTSNG